MCLAVAMHLACFQPCINDAGVLRFVRPYRSTAHTPGTQLLMPDGAAVSKQSIRRILAIISRLYPLARPTRGMLKQVFNFFEPPHNVAASAAAVAASSKPVLAADTEAETSSGNRKSGKECDGSALVHDLLDETSAGFRSSTCVLRQPALSI